MRNQETKRCAICGRMFIPIATTNIYCSQECRRKGKSMKRKERLRKMREVYMRECPICGKTFETMHKTKKYCCQGCQKEAVNLRAREYYIQKKDWSDEKKQDSLRRERKRRREMRQIEVEEMKRIKRKKDDKTLGPLYTIEEIEKMARAEGVSYGIMAARLQDPTEPR